MQFWWRIQRNVSYAKKIQSHLFIYKHCHTDVRMEHLTETRYVFYYYYHYSVEITGKIIWLTKVSAKRVTECCQLLNDLSAADLFLSVRRRFILIHKLLTGWKLRVQISMNPGRDRIWKYLLDVTKSAHGPIVWTLSSISASAQDRIPWPTRSSCNNQAKKSSEFLLAIASHSFKYIDRKIKS